MADKTTNLNLTLTNDTDATTTTFKQWRESINGETDSNMQKIDAFAGTTNLLVNAAFAALTNKVDKDTNNTLTGTNTFNGAVFVRTPSQDYQPATKKYVDDKVSALNIENGTGDGSLFMNNTASLTEPDDGGDKHTALTTSDAPQANGTGAFAVGIGTRADGDVSVAEGILTKAGYERTDGTRSIGSHAEGVGTFAKSSASHAEGYYNQSLASNSHTEGFFNTVESTAWSGHAEGRENTVAGKAAHAEGYLNTITDTAHNAHAEGENTSVSAQDAHAEGYKSVASGYAAHAEGASASDSTATTASGRAAHAEGSGTTSSGAASHAEGGKTVASGNQAHAEGFNTQATALYSHAEGVRTHATASAAHAEGADTYATGEAAHAEGKANKASGKYSHTGGFGNEAKNFAGTVIGQYAKISDKSSVTYDSTAEAFVVGNGTADNARSNAFEVHFDGTAKLGDKNVATEEYANRAFANALRGSASGEVVTLDDVSPVEHTISVNVRSKNLFDLSSAEKISGGSTYEKTENAITVSQTNAGVYQSANFEIPNATFLIGKTVTVSGKVKTSGANKARLRVMWMNDGAVTTGTDVITSAYTGTDETQLSASGIINPPKESSYKLCILFYSNVASGLESAIYSATYSDIQIELGSTATDYTPYVYPTAVTVTRCGKNLLTAQDVYKSFNAYSELVYDGRNCVSFETSEAVKIRPFNFASNTSYTVSFDVKTVIKAGITEATKSGTVFRIFYTDGTVGSITSSYVDEAWNHKSLTSDSSKTIDYIGCSSIDSKYTNYIDIDTFQFERNATETDYEAYSGETYTPASDGTVDGVTSLYPTTTLMTDTDGVIIDVRYNRDANKVIEKLEQAIISLGGNI